MNIQARKQALRQSIIAARSKIAEAEQQRASAAITQRITQLAGYRAAQKVLGYLNFGAEYAAELLVQQALGDGKQVWLPKLNRTTNMLDIYRVTDLLRDVAPGAWHIREPLAERCEQLQDLAEIEWVLLPGVAFTRSGERLGYGGGYYDKLIASMPHMPMLVAGAYKVQVVSEIPQENTDCKIAWLVTEHETIACKQFE